MFERFSSVYCVDRNSVVEVSKQLLEKAIPQQLALEATGYFSQFNGASFRSGLYRAVSLDAIQKWNALIHGVFPTAPSETMPIGYDWLGRFFCVDVEGLSRNENRIFLLCPYSSDALEIPADFVGFHNNVLVDQMHPAVEDELFDKFKENTNLSMLPINTCVGLITPTFLGGELIIENMHLIDVEVYWDLTAQLISQLRHQ